MEGPAIRDFHIRNDTANPNPRSYTHAEKAPRSYAVLILHIIKEKALTLAQRFHRMSPEC